MTSRFTLANEQAWYTCFDPVGTYGNVHFLFPRHSEWQASVGGQRRRTQVGNDAGSTERDTEETER